MATPAPQPIVIQQSPAGYSGQILVGALAWVADRDDHELARGRRRRRRRMTADEWVALLLLAHLLLFVDLVAELIERRKRRRDGD